MDVLNKIVRDAIADVLCSSAQDSDELSGQTDLVSQLGFDSLDFHELRFCLEQRLKKRTGQEIHLDAPPQSPRGTVTVDQVATWVREQLHRAGIELPAIGKKP